MYNPLANVFFPTHNVEKYARQHPKEKFQFNAPSTLAMAGMAKAATDNPKTFLAATVISGVVAGTIVGVLDGLLERG